MNNFFDSKNENIKQDEILQNEILHEDAVYVEPSLLENEVPEEIVEEQAAAVETVEATPEASIIYREVVEKKRKTSGLLIASVLSAGLMLGTVFGFTLDNFILDRNNNGYRETASVGYVVNEKGLSIPWIAEKVSPSVVSIRTKGVTNYSFFGNYESQGIGSGVIISNDGYIVTNNHVIESANDIRVVLSSGKEYKAKLINRDAAYDLAVLKIEATGLPYVEFGDSDKLKVGEPAVAIGNPIGMKYAGSVTAGIISGLNREFENLGQKAYYIQTDAAINPGNSGGALVNHEGKVIGINTLKLQDNEVEGMGFAIPSNEVMEIVDDLINRPVMGITGRTISKEDSEQYKVPQGIFIAELTPYGGAERAGIKKGDIITHIDGERVMTIEELIKKIKTYKIGDTVEVQVVNQEEKQSTVKVKLSKIGE